MYIYFDLDSTLCNLEGCDRLATKQGVGKHVAELTKATMDGTRSFDEVFITKTQLVSPSRDDLVALGQEYIATLTPGIVELIKELQKADHTIGILSQGYRDSALIVGRFLNIKDNDIHALVFDHNADGSYAGFPEQALKYENGKAVTLREIKKRFPEEKIVYIGDSVGDVNAGQQADQFIGCGINIIREKVQKETKLFVTSVDELRHLLKIHLEFST